MLATAVIGLVFNLIQIKILHSGEGHYHLGGEGACSHDHGHAGHDHLGHSHAAENHIHTGTCSHAKKEEHVHTGNCSHSKK